MRVILNLYEYGLEVKVRDEDGNEDSDIIFLEDLAKLLKPYLEGLNDA